MFEPVTSSKEKRGAWEHSRTAAEEGREEKVLGAAETTKGGTGRPISTAAVRTGRKTGCEDKWGQWLQSLSGHCTSVVDVRIRMAMASDSGIERHVMHPLGSKVPPPSHHAQPGFDASDCSCMIVQLHTRPGCQARAWERSLLQRKR